jgi:hypothetical protein
MSVVSFILGERDSNTADIISDGLLFGLDYDEEKVLYCPCRYSNLRTSLTLPSDMTQFATEYHFKQEVLGITNSPTFPI